MKNASFIAICTCIIMVFMVGIAAGAAIGEHKVRQEIANTPVIAPTPVTVPQQMTPVIIEVDGINCVMSEQPVFTYYAATDVVRVNIECDGDIMDYYRPALVPGDQ